MADGNDLSNGWEAVVPQFFAARSRIGVATVRTWAEQLPPGASILDLGCGTGVPIAEALIADGFAVYGVDASRSMVAAFRSRFPTVPVICEAAEDSGFFGQAFDGVIGIGLLFLLPPAAQMRLLRRVKSALRPAGRFLFTAPKQECAWKDILTARPSVSLGAPAYRAILGGVGLTVVANYTDEGGGYYHEATLA